MSFYQEGYDAFTRGESRYTNPHDVGTEAESEWDRGYDDADSDTYTDYNDSLSCGCCSCCGCCGCSCYPDDEEEFA